MIKVNHIQLRISLNSKSIPKIKCNKISIRKEILIKIPKLTLYRIAQYFQLLLLNKKYNKVTIIKTEHWRTNNLQIWMIQLIYSKSIYKIKYKYNNIVLYQNWKWKIFKVIKKIQKIILNSNNHNLILSNIHRNWRFNKKIHNNLCNNIQINNNK